MAKSYLKLADGHVFEGESFGAEGSITGEIVFTTSMVGYLKTLADPRYYGQMVVQTFPLIGNYGVIPAELSGFTPKLSAYIVREYCQEPSNFRSEGTLDDFLLSKGIIGLSGIDTRELTRIIRNKGVMAAKITADPDDNEGLENFSIENALEAVRISPRVPVEGNGPRLSLWDFGAGAELEALLGEKNCALTAFAYDAAVEDILKTNPDGIVLSPGPGDPRENPELIARIKVLAERNIPILAVGLGHQLLALAMGLEVEKLKHGHRGANQPVVDKKSGRIYITSQNHGYAVKADFSREGISVSFENATDTTCEGLEYSSKPFVSVQFVPEKGRGALDMSFIYDEFLSLMEVK